MLKVTAFHSNDILMRTHSHFAVRVFVALELSNSFLWWIDLTEEAVCLTNLWHTPPVHITPLPTAGSHSDSLLIQTENVHWLKASSAAIFRCEM